MFDMKLTSASEFYTSVEQKPFLVKITILSIIIHQYGTVLVNAICIYL